MTEKLVKEPLAGSSMGQLTIERYRSGWIVLEDGLRVGGTVRHLFANQAAARRYVDAELADEAEIMANGDVGLCARCRFIRGTDPKVWAKIERINEKFADDEDAWKAAHIAAGTWGVLIEMELPVLVAREKLEIRLRDDGQNVYAISGPAS